MSSAVMRGDAFERAADRAAIGMVGKRRWPTSCGWRSLGLVLWRCSREIDLRADALDRGGVEARLVQREPQQLEGLVLVFLERAQRAADMFAAGANLQLDRLALQPLLERRAVELAGAFVERRRPSSRRAPPLSAGSCAAPPRKAKLIATSGTVASRTSQNSMPPGLTTRSILVALAGARARAAPRRSERQRAEPRDAARANRQMLLIGHERSSLEPAGLTR